MPVVRRLGGWLFGTAGALGLLLCVAALVGCWVAYFEGTRRVDGLFGRTEQALAEVQDNMRQAADRLRETQSELGAVEGREVNRASEPPADRAARRALSRKAVEALGPRLGESRELVAKATEVGLVANGFLEAVAELPVVERVRVDTDRLKETSRQLTDLTDRAARLGDLLARAAPPADEEVAREASGAGDVLRRSLDLTDAGVERLDSGRRRVSEAHARVRGWIGWAAGIITVVTLWVAAGQFSLLIHGRSLARR